MNPNYMEHKFPQIKPHPFNRVHPMEKLSLMFAFFMEHGDEEL